MVPQKQQPKKRVSRPMRAAAPGSRVVTTSMRTQRRRTTQKTVTRRPQQQSFPWPLLALPVIALLIAGAVFGVQSCSRQTAVEIEASERSARETAEYLYRNPYTWTNILTDAQGRYVYKTGATTTLSRVGIDVSEHQGEIDWQRVAADGIEFAFIRVGYRTSDRGTIMADARFEYNVSEARSAGIEVGVYFFSQAVDEGEAREEADFVLQTIGRAEFDYPVVFDLEPATDGSDRVGKLSTAELTAVAKAFCDRMSQNGHSAMIYGNQNDLSHYNLTELVNYDLWYAEYDKRPTMDLRFVIWQYSRTGRVDGISGDVDLDIDLSEALRKIEDPQTN